MTSSLTPIRAAWCACACIVALALIAPAAPARQTDAGPADNAPAAEPQDEQSGQPTLDEVLERLPPEGRIGLRVSMLQSRWPLEKTLVIASDAATYVQAIGRWSAERRFPVLIDDGTVRAQINIARFVRAFEPERVVRLEPLGDREIGLVDDRGSLNTPLVERAALRAWGVDSLEMLENSWSSRGFDPPGVVVASRTDPAWTAALALAAGRGQRIAWIGSPPGDRGTVLDVGRFEQLRSAVHDAVEALGRPWRDKGDQIEALTLCLNMPHAVITDDGMFAITDMLGRHASGDRWAWAGMLPGDEQHAAYRAMCALFLQPRSAWLFDGYPPSFAAPYSIEPAIDQLSALGFDVQADTAPNEGEQRWLLRAQGGVDAGLVHINSSGQRTYFELWDRNADARDRIDAHETPVMLQPAAVHFIHSFSAQTPNHTGTILARWLDQGAFVYAGAMDEPRLGAFQTPADLARRLLGAAPWGVGVRRDNAPLWKVNVFGDPLFVLSQPPPAAQADALIAFANGRPLSEVMQDAVRAEDLAGAVRALSMLGRAGDARDLARAAFGQRPEALTPELARAALWPAFVLRDAELMTNVYPLLPPGDRRDPLMTSLLWQTLRPTLDGEPSRMMLDVLADHARPQRLVDDARELRPAVRRSLDADAWEAMLLRLIRSTDDADEQQELRRLMPR